MAAGIRSTDNPGYLNIQGIRESIFPQDDLFKAPVTESKIVEFYKDQYVFVTGATGFLGKLLVEKLLRACVDIAGVFILVREKKGEDVKTRVQKLYDDAVFEPLRKQQPNFREKIHIIQGDTVLPNLGINKTDRQQLADKINVVFHGAATVRFDEPLTDTIKINVKGTRDLIEMCKDFKRLKAFVYVSTAYSHCIKHEIDEIQYDPPLTTEQSLELIQDDGKPSTSTDIYLSQLEKWPNNYICSKAIAEDTVREYVKGFPACIYRPSIVMATYKEPIQSWIDNVYGATGIVVGSGMGAIKTLYCDETKLADIVPGDYVINGMIAASYRTAINKKKPITIYNYVSSIENPINWKRFLHLNASYGNENPPIQAIWCFALTLNSNKYIHLLYVFFLHFIPGLLMDAVSLALGKPAIMVKTYKKINKFMDAIGPFCTQEWKFKNNNIQNLWTSLSESDRSLFPFSMKDLDWDEYFQTHTMGLRTYIIKDDPSTLPEAKIRWRRFIILNRIFKITVRLLGLYFVYLILSTVFHYLF